MEPFTTEELRRAVQLALAEDIGSGDATSLATVPADAAARGVMRAREPLVVAGLATFVDPLSGAESLATAQQEVRLTGQG